MTAGKDRYRFFVEQTTEGILVIDTDTKYIIETNQAYCQLLGYNRAEIIGNNLYQLLETKREILNKKIRSYYSRKPLYYQGIFSSSSKWFIACYGRTNKPYYLSRTRSFFAGY